MILQINNLMYDITVTNCIATSTELDKLICAKLLKSDHTLEKFIN